MTAPQTITSEIQKLAPSAVIELFELDATSLGDSVYRFHAGTNALNQDIVFAGETYARFPVEIDGFEITGNGQLPRPKIRVANLSGAISFLVITLGDLIGAKVTRRRTMVKYLDGVNFPFPEDAAESLVLDFTAGAESLGTLPAESLSLDFTSGTYTVYEESAEPIGYYAEDSIDTIANPDADPTAQFPEDIFFVDRKSIENRNFVEFELSASFDVAGVQLPRRQIIQNVCPWKYKGLECGYAGTNYFDTNDQPVGSALLDRCGKRLNSCEIRFGANQPLPFGGFPSAGLVK